MSEIEKMYENAGIEPDINYVCDKEPCEQHSVDCQECSHLYDTREDYPDFTAEKQLKLIEFFISSVWWLNLKSLHKTLDYSLNFEDKLAKMVNYLWLSLTPEEKQQIKEILE